MKVLKLTYDKLLKKSGSKFISIFLTILGLPLLLLSLSAKEEA